MGQGRGSLAGDGFVEREEDVGQRGVRCELDGIDIGGGSGVADVEERLCGGGIVGEVCEVFLEGLCEAFDLRGPWFADKELFKPVGDAVRWVGTALEDHPLS